MKPSSDGACGELVADPLEHAAVVAQQVELVDRQRHRLDAEQADDVAVAQRLGGHAALGVDQDHRGVGGRGARDHVARVLLVAGRVDDDERALRRREVAVRHVDRDALLALRPQAVEQQREVEVAVLGTGPDRVRRQRLELVVEDHLRLVEQPADQRALAVVDAAAGDEAQAVLAPVGVEVLGECGGSGDGHQKYPCCFLISIDPSESRSITRPWRSEVLVASISSTMSSVVVAPLSTAPVSG